MKLLSLERLKNIKLEDLITPKIVRYVWVAKDDPKTCEYCASRNGMVVEATDPEYDIYMPPAHPHCRCFFKVVTSDAEVIPNRSWVKPSDNLITRFAPFLFIIPFKGKRKEPIDVFPFAPESPNPNFNPEDIFPLGKYDAGRKD